MGIRFYNLNGFFVKKLAHGVYYRYITFYIMTKETANVKMRRKDFPNYFPAQARKKPEQMPRRIAVAFLESAVHFTRKAVSAVCPAIRSSTVTCQ